MNYPTQYHETVKEVEYRVHGFTGIIFTSNSLVEARTAYAKEKDSTGIAMITKKTMQHLYLEDLDYVQGSL